MGKGQDYIGKVKKLIFPNKGLVEVEGNTVYVKGTLPEQKVRFILTKKRKTHFQGRLVEVIERSKLENREKACKHFPECGGCSYQELSYENQLSLKSGQVKELIDSVCKDYIYEGIIGSPIEWAYRNKMEFSFGDEFKGGDLALGMHKKKSIHDIVNIEECKIVDEDYNSILKLTRDHFLSRNIPFRNKNTNEGYLRHLLVRRASKTGEISVNLVTTSQEYQGLELDLLKDKLLALNLNGKIVGITHITNDALGDVVKNEGMKILYGRDYIFEELLGLKFKISTFSFFQTNSLGAEVLYSKARDYIGDVEGQTVFDLYSGTGTIAQILAPYAKEVVGVEIVEEAVLAARENAELNELDNCHFICGDVLKVIDEIKQKPDLIVLDPPRDGIAPKALQKIIDFNVDKIIYISCKPTSLIRDLEVFQEAGYKLEKACAVDMFPQSFHVETVVLMSHNM